MAAGKSFSLEQAQLLIDWPADGGSNMIQEHLEGIAQTYDPEQDFDYHLIRYGFERIRQYLHGERVLEMGCASGVMTRELLKCAKSLHVVEGARHYLDRLMNRPEFGNVTFFHALFEAFSPEIKYTDVIMARALEHVNEPVALLERVRHWLVRDGRLHVIVPNADSLHRRVGVALGMLTKTTDLSERDRKYGHQRVYQRDLLERHLVAAKFTIRHYEGIFLKPLSNAQMATWSQELLDAFNIVGRELPGWCAELYMVASPT